MYLHLGVCCPTILPWAPEGHGVLGMMRPRSLDDWVLRTLLFPCGWPCHNLNFASVNLTSPISKGEIIMRLCLSQSLFSLLISDLPWCPRALVLNLWHRCHSQLLLSLKTLKGFPSLPQRVLESNPSQSEHKIMNSPTILSMELIIIGKWLNCFVKCMFCENIDHANMHV